MIERVNGFKAGENVFASLQDAQAHELQALLGTAGSYSRPNGQIDIKDAAQILIDCSEQVVDILTTSPKSRAKARKINGAKRTRKASAPAVPEGNGATVKGVAS